MCPDLAMRRVNIADLKDQLLPYLRAVEQGAEVEVTDRGRPIVRMMPVRSLKSEIRIIPARKAFRDVRKRRFPKGHWRAGSLQLLLEERGRR